MMAVKTVITFLGQDPTSRISRKPNKPKRSNTATSSSVTVSARPNSRLERSRNGKSLENKRSPSDERKRYEKYSSQNSKTYINLKTKIDIRRFVSYNLFSDF